MDEGEEVVKFWEVVFWILEVRSWIWRVEKEEFWKKEVVLVYMKRRG
jgi:hypothetical protein